MFSQSWMQYFFWGIQHDFNHRDLLGRRAVLTQSKPAGQFVRADLTVTECQKREESSLLKSSFNEDLSRLMTATKMSVLCQSNALRSLNTLSISICFYCPLWCLIEANVKQLFGKKTACMLYADPSAQLRDKRGCVCWTCGINWLKFWV